MPVPNDIKKQVQDYVLKNLDEYFKNMEDVEDLDLQTNPDLEARVKDFYLAMYTLHVEGQE